ncbi:MAG: metallophosphoesterase [Sulfolobales archaeon]
MKPVGVRELELVPGLEIVGELPVAYSTKYKTLILADVHIGFEEEVLSRGGFIPRFQLKNTIRILEDAFSRVNVERVVFAGDLKHLFDTLGRLERVELVELLTYVKKHVDSVVVVRGNHDNFLPAMRKWVEFDIVDSYSMPPYLIVHGHKPLKEETLYHQWDYLIIGHEHPSIALRDPLGIVGKFSCFLIGAMPTIKKKIVILPAVGAYQTGSRVTLMRETYLSPVIREHVDLETIKPVVVGTDIGVLEFPTLKELYDIIT